MPLKKLLFKPGVNRENTRYTNEGGYFESDKIRFRQGTPEKIGGWTRISNNIFLGVCRSLWTWITLAFKKLTGVGTNLKFYIENIGAYYDITPIRYTSTLTNPLTTDTTKNSGGYTTITVTDANLDPDGNTFDDGDYVTLYGSAGNITVGGVTITSGSEYQITLVTTTSYTISVLGTASSSTTGGGTVYAVYQINVGSAAVTPVSGWGAGSWGTPPTYAPPSLIGTWGYGAQSNTTLRLWNQQNVYQENLLYGPRGGPLYYWTPNIGFTASPVTISFASPAVVTSGVGLDEYTPITLTTTGYLPPPLIPGKTYYVLNASSGGTVFNLSLTAGGAAINTSAAGSGTQAISPRGILLSSLYGTYVDDAFFTGWILTSDVPLYQNYMLVSDINEYAICFGTNLPGETTLNPMAVRWSTAGRITDWEPNSNTYGNDAGFQILSHGSRIVTAVQSRQEIIVFTDSSLYSMQFAQGGADVWRFQLLGDNISIIGSNAATIASGALYWMGVDKFYRYDGRISTLRCDLRNFIFENINKTQSDQVFCSTNEGFNEIWWFYCIGSSTTITNYVVYNYAEDIWYYGTMGRTAWLDSGLNNYPLAATYIPNLVEHENGIDDNSVPNSSAAAVEAYILSSEFDIDDGDRFGFVWRVVPDITFRQSTAGTSPTVTMTLLPMQNSGSGYNNPTSLGGESYASVVSSGDQTITAGGKSYTIEQFTGQIYTRVRGRQMAFSVWSNQVGTTWQLGSPRMDIRQDGRR
jgi:hypothetical protein